MKIIIEKELFQWETNRLVDIELEPGDDIITSIEIYSDNSRGSQDIPYSGKAIVIPDYFLQNSKIVVISAKSEKGIVLRKEFNVLYRKKPDKYQPSPEQGIDLEELKKYVDEAISKALDDICLAEELSF